MIIRFLSSLN